jgi:predicted dehydrogenase
MSFIRVGIIGFGKMGQVRAESMANIPDVKITKVFDTAPIVDAPCAVAASAEEIVADPDIDAVFICTPNFLNRPLTIGSLKAKKHVFCEKPPALNAAEVAEVQAVEAQGRQVLMYGFNHRQHFAVIKMKALIDSGDYGDILWMRGRYGKAVDADYLRGWRAKKELAGGGILIDQGIHMLDLFLHVAGRPFDDVHAFVSSLYWKMEGIEDNVFATMRNTASGLTASLHSTMTQWRHLFSFEVFLSRGYMVLNGLKTGSGSYGDEELVVSRHSPGPTARHDSEQRFRYDVDSSWSFEANHFFEAIRTGQKVRYGSSDNAYAVMDLIDRIYAHDRHEAPKLYEDLQRA